jgi:hypothetical protein
MSFRQQPRNAGADLGRFLQGDYCSDGEVDKAMSAVVRASSHTLRGLRDLFPVLTAVDRCRALRPKLRQIAELGETAPSVFPSELYHLADCTSCAQDLRLLQLLVREVARERSRQALLVNPDPDRASSSQEVFHGPRNR